VNCRSPAPRRVSPTLRPSILWLSVTFADALLVSVAPEVLAATRQMRHVAAIAPRSPRASPPRCHWPRTRRPPITRWCGSCAAFAGCRWPRSAECWVGPCLAASWVLNTVVRDASAPPLGTWPYQLAPGARVVAVVARWPPLEPLTTRFARQRFASTRILATLPGRPSAKGGPLISAAIGWPLAPWCVVMASAGAWWWLAAWLAWVAFHC